MADECGDDDVHEAVDNARRRWCSCPDQLNSSAHQFLQFWMDSVLKILNERIPQSVNELVNYEDVYKTAPATPGLLKNDWLIFFYSLLSIFIFASFAQGLWAFNIVFFTNSALWAELV